MTFTVDDVKRVLWTFVMAAGAVAIASATDILGGHPVAWRTVLVAAFAAGLSAVKNLLTPTGSVLK
jgi:hypothetical protein